MLKGGGGTTRFEDVLTWELEVLAIVMGGRKKFPPFNPIDPNPAVAALAVFPQSGRSRPEKRLFFHIFPHFSKIEPSKKYLPHIGVQYIKLKVLKCWFRCIVSINRYALAGLWIWRLALNSGEILREFGKSIHHMGN